ncbi:hypothetical protein HUJ04_000731 [Dendroctonus ponderosae]|nr:hypothetical protein HUJ04_000731 [Dendroctonus ponderosae]KAH1011334.1 hypothetical protein HUJ04_000731 [Dendroctonus ponderosae]KAH1011335.1 hypothetical protein HUJ04_000731 [Dendroctonus ponderosae]
MGATFSIPYMSFLPSLHNYNRSFFTQSQNPFVSFAVVRYRMHLLLLDSLYKKELYEPKTLLLTLRCLSGSSLDVWLSYVYRLLKPEALPEDPSD